MEVNETNRPLTDVPVDKAPETPVEQPTTEAQPVEEKVEEEAVAQPAAEAITKPEEIVTFSDTEQQEETETKENAVKEKEETTVPKPEPKKTKQEILDRLKEIDANNGKTEKQELDLLKQTFYKLHKAEIEVAKKAFEENGGKPEDFVAPVDDTENQFKTLMSSIKEKRSVIAAEEIKEQKENLQKKLQIIDKIKALSEGQDDANKSYNEFKRLQQEWNNIKSIPSNKVNELWRSYQLYSEKFYDLIKLSNEFREYDFKKNLEIKTHLCEAAEKLTTEPDAVSAFHQLQKLHQEFRETGPIAKDLREQIWTRFKAASTIVNRRHQEHFEKLKEEEQTNLDAKIVICEIAESIEFDKLKSFRDWDNKTQEILALQAKWKTIGYAPRKLNVKIFERFRAACDNFFKKKGEFFKQMKDDMNSNLEKKRALVEKAEALKDSTDWKKTAEELSALQKEWKAIGPVAKKHSDAIWKRFIAACDYFFEERNKNNSSQHTEEQDNLKTKKNIIQQLTSLNNEENSEEGIEDKIRDLMKQWNEIGHVPFREKDKIYKQYHAIIDSLSDKFNISAKRFSGNARSAMKNIKNIEGKERDKLTRIYETMKNEIQTYENNLGFFTASSKKGNGLMDEMKKKVEKLKEEAEEVRKKIADLDAEEKESQEEKD
ncbi:MAG: DUF349 domain-containing protein [Phocaeicola sp.]|uniref:DUF349 domain-containing protein n=1 Tax=Phocaeicola sp. TaxID=2773926 RepID=UPI003F9F90A0